MRIMIAEDQTMVRQAAMAAGARGFLLKDAPAADLAAAIRRVAGARNRGEAVHIAQQKGWL